MLACLAHDLKRRLGYSDHRRGTYWIGGQDSSARVDRQLSGHLGDPVVDESPPLARLAEPQVLVHSEFGIGCRLVHLSDVEILQRAGDTSFGIRGATGGLQRAHFGKSGWTVAHVLLIVGG